MPRGGISEFKSVSRSARSIAACKTLNADACLRAIAATISAAVEGFGLLAAMAILVPITDDNAVPEAEGRDYYRAARKSRGLIPPDVQFFCLRFSTWLALNDT
jgi:hypothetical protein